jgi:tetratricopeptide (TPR) repeat protein
MSKKPAQKKTTPRPQNVEQTMSLAWQAYGEGRPREAETLCAQLVKMHPEHAHAWFLRGLAVATLGKPQLALKHFDKVTNAPDLLPALAQSRGRALMALDRLDEALDRFQEALAYKPDDASTYYFLGVAKMTQGDGDEARRFMRQCALLEPAFGPAHYELGVLAMQVGQAAQAATHFRAACEHLGASPEAANNLGLALQASGDAAGAETSYRRALELNPDYAEAWFNLGTLLRATGQAEADAALKKALKLKPELADAHA